MSGHSHHSTIKRKKDVVDQKRGQIFSKLLSAIAIAARTESNPEFNPRLRTAIEKAKQNKVPQDNIERAVRRASEDKNLEELTMEAYGPEGAAILIEAITDNKNRTIAEIKKILSEAGAKWAESGSVRWAFVQVANEKEMGWQAKFKQEISPDAKEKIQALVDKLENHDDIQGVYANAEL
ncbi:YebC/PmpR family DNA-binding transcriptional regulator [Candidatus Wolfebacteria bacterium]|nr:YebC/PmpR family DNA-binding transcriptional regulator [Candidatus Wolfebacteria bacterium]